MDAKDKLLVVAGPTASGKSGLALAAAQEFGGMVINADSMQVYDGLRVLTARPSEAEEALAPHRLYGILPPSEACSAGRWLELAKAAVAEARLSGLLPIVVGGTGLYLRALTQGLSPIPDIPDAVREASRALFDRLGNAAFHAALAERDPVVAGRLHPSNSQRLVRAWEVLEATGRSLADWQEIPPSGAVDAQIATIVLDPPRALLNQTCDRRFLAMVEQGALEEVRALLDLDLDPALPVMKALGVPDLAAHLRGRLGREEAIARAQQATRQYAKRQGTWFRHQMKQAEFMPAQFSESLRSQIFPKLRQFLLTNIPFNR
jgi:tRNA dimethylallyltransferase